MSERTRLSAHRRYKVLERDGFTCRYCGAQAPDVALEVDHVRAVALGGRNDYDNLVTACITCNRGKSAKPFVNSAELASEVVVLRRQLKEARASAIRIGKEAAEWARTCRLQGITIELLMTRLGAPKKEHPFVSEMLSGIRKRHATDWTLPADLQQRLDEREAA